MQHRHATLSMVGTLRSHEMVMSGDVLVWPGKNGRFDDI